MEMGSAPQAHQRSPGIMVDHSQNGGRQRSKPLAPQVHYHPSQTGSNTHHELRHPPPEFVQYKQYISHLHAAAGNGYRQVRPSMPNVPRQSDVAGGPRQATPLSAFTATPSHAGTNFAQRTPSQTLPQHAATIQSHAKPGLRYHGNVSVAAAPRDAPTPTPVLSKPHDCRISQRTQKAPVSTVTTPVLAPHTRTPSAYSAEPPTTSVSTIDVLQRRMITEGLKRLEALERSLETLNARAVTTDLTHSSALAGLDRRLSHLEQSFNVTKTRRSESLDAEAAPQNICHIPERAPTKVPNPDDGIAESSRANMRRVSPLPVNQMASGRSKDGRREISKRYDLRRRPRRQD